MNNIIRVQKNKENPYVIMNKKFLEDKNLSFKAKGLLAYLLSKPDDWNTNVKQLITVSKENEKAIYSAIRELINNGYMTRQVVYKNKKICNWIYTIFEEKNLETIENSLLSQKLQVDNLHVENVDYTNNKYNNISEEEEIPLKNVNSLEVYNSLDLDKKIIVSELYSNGVKGVDIDLVQEKLKALNQRCSKIISAT